MRHLPRLPVLLLLAAVAFCQPARADDLPLIGDSTVRFASAGEAADLIATRDTFVDALGPFDRAIRLRSADPVTVEQYLAYVRTQVLPWTDEQRAAMAQTVDVAAGMLTRAGVDLPNLPDRITLVATTGREEFNAAYTRGAAIYLPRSKLDAPPPQRLRLFLHELFHVVSRTDPALRDRLYRVIGFIPCGTVTLPEGLHERRIVNPDGPVIEHRIEITHDGRQVSAVPVLFSRVERYDPQQGASLFRFLVFRLMVVEQHDGAWRPRLDDGKPILLEPRTNASFLEQIGRNTGYIIHPDEVLAENFVLLVTGETEVPSPHVLVKMGELLAAAAPAE